VTLDIGRSPSVASVPNAEVAIFSPYDSKAAVAAVGTN